MSTRTILSSLALIALTFGAAGLLGTGNAQADPVCTMGGPRPICVNKPNPGATIGPVVHRPAQEPHCYYLPTTANGAVNGLRRVCQ